jgi:hypothetical protein
MPQVAALADIGEDILDEVEYLMVWWAGGGGMVSSVVIMLDSSMREMLARCGYVMNGISCLGGSHVIMRNCDGQRIFGVEQ